MQGNLILNKLGQNIREARLRLKLSQEQLSFQSGLDRSYIGGVERGERNVSVLNLCKIATSLNVSPSQLLVNVLQDIEQHVEQKNKP